MYYSMTSFEIGLPGSIEVSRYFWGMQGTTRWPRRSLLRCLYL